jgi:hypothetical protein
MTSSENGSSESLNISDDNHPPEIPVCNAMTVIYGDGARIKVYCCLKKRHHGDHYDSTFSFEWARYK